MASAVSIALGLLPDGTREVLGLWIEQSWRDQATVRGTVVPDTGAKFWLRVALNSKLRRAIRARGHFPNDEAATKLLSLVLNRAAADWTRPPREWVEARTQFAITFGERFRIS